VSAVGFTPGPWYANGHSVYEDAERVRTPEQRQGGQINIPLMTAVTGRGNAIHNALLAAAAPELYEALVALTRAVNTNELAAAMACHEIVALANVEDALKLALPAIKKARGEQ
jgi:hypothetical protein